jgi:hypothetical protein
MGGAGSQSALGRATSLLAPIEEVMLGAIAGATQGINIARAVRIARTVRELTVRDKT